jgi:tetratricopeptide (TPR) repeat protein
VYRTASGAILGTPGYMAPEQALGQEAGAPADVYALGAILYEAVTGRPPFRAATVLQTLEQVRSQEPVPPSRLQTGLPRDLQTICLKCLQKSPGNRYPSAAALADDLGRFLRGESILARPATPWERAWKWARRHPSAAGLLVVSAVALATVVTSVVVYNARLVAAVTRAEAGEERARTQQIRADANYHKARDTVQRMLDRLNSMGLASVPRLRELEQQQLEDALAFYLGVLHDLDNPDPDVRLDVARSCRQTARLQSQLGRREPAEKNLRQAIDLAEGLRAEDPEAVDYRAELAAACAALGEVLRPQITRHREAERWLKQGLSLSREVAAAEPTAQRRSHLAGTLQTLANLYLQMDGHFLDSKVHLDEAAGIWQQLARERPDEDLFHVNLAGAYSDLGHFHEWSRPARPDDAEAVYRKAEPLLEALVRKHPGKIEWAASLASLYSRQGNILLNHHRKAEDALKRFTSALDTVQTLLKQEPSYAPAGQLLIHAHGGRAYAYVSLGRFKKAVPEWDRVVELEDRPDLKPFRRSERAVVLAQAGDHVRASAEAAALGAAAPVKDAVLGSALPVKDAVLYNAACAYSIAIKAALQDQRLSEKERKALAEKYGAAGVALLRRLREAGFFKDPNWIRVLSEDADFGPLRLRPDAQKLLRELHAK